MYRTIANKVFTFNLYRKHEIKSNYSMQEMIVWVATLKKNVYTVFLDNTFIFH